MIDLRRTTAAAAALALSALLLVGCGDDEPSTTGDGEQAAGSTPAGDVAYPDEGVDLVDVPELEGVYQDVLQVYVDFERGRRLAARQGGGNQLLAFNAVDSVVRPIKQAAQRLPEDARYDGTVVIEFVDAVPRDTVLTIDVCVDATDLVVPDAAPAALGEATRAPQRIQVANLQGPWRVTQVRPGTGSC